MRGKLALTFLAGLAVGPAAAFAGPRPRAEAQPPAAPARWEYKVVALPYGPDEATRQMNQLAEDRWEYVGLVTTARPGNPPRDATVAFRRPKK
jgi:hypothetical protein